VKTCPTCRSANLDSAIVCVNCGTSIGVAPMPGAPVEIDPVEMSAGATDATPVPPTAVRRATITAVIALVALVAAIAIVVLMLAGGDGFPTTVGGKPRIQGDNVDQVEKALKSFEVDGVTFEIAVYGTGELPSIVVLRAAGDTGVVQTMSSDQFFSAFGLGLAQQTGVIDTSRAVTRTIDGIDYICFAASHPAGATTDGSVCAYRSDTIGVLISTTFAPRDAVDLAREVAEA
jgi:hypothetical protein